MDTTDAKNLTAAAAIDPSSVDSMDAEICERQDRERKAGLHPLKHKFVLWCTQKTPGVRTQTSYKDSIKKIAEFNSVKSALERKESSINCGVLFFSQLAYLSLKTFPSQVEAFWMCYCRLVRPANLPSSTDLHLFKEGIHPLWEDSANCTGGKWIIRFKKAVSGRFWEDLVLALVGDQLEHGDNICGAVLSVRHNEDLVSVWNRDASDQRVVIALGDAIKCHLKLPHSYVMEYKPHDASLRDNSSYRNTWLRG